MERWSKGGEGSKVEGHFSKGHLHFLKLSELNFHLQVVDRIIGQDSFEWKAGGV